MSPGGKYWHPTCMHHRKTQAHSDILKCRFYVGIIMTRLFLSLSLIAIFSVPAEATTFAGTYGDGTCVNGDVTASSLSVTYDATSCIGRIEGNDAAEGGDPLMGLLEDGVFGDYEWEFLGKSDDSPPAFAADHDETSGEWWLNAGDVINGPFAISFKHGSGWSAFYFESVVGVTHGAFTLPYLESGGERELSHASLFVVNQVTIPAPGGLVLFAAGLAVFAAFRRRLTSTSI